MPAAIPQEHSDGTPPGPERSRLPEERHTRPPLLAAGCQTHLVRDAICSRYSVDWEAAIERLRDSGTVITTTESVLFEWLGKAGTPEFKEILRLVK